MRRGLILLLLLTAARPAAAQNPSTPGALELYPTLEAIGVRLAYTGDANGNATASLEWRPAGTGPWTPGVSMTRITSSRWAGSVLWLTPGTAYEVRATIADPDGGGTVTGSATTRPEVSRGVTGRTWWVATNGNDGAAGTSAAPLATIQHAADLAQAGDEIRLRPGVYYQGLDTPVAGTASAPIALVGDAPGVVLDGADPAYLSRSDWRNDGGGVFSVPYTGTTKLVCVDSLMRLYHQASVADLQAGANGISQGWAVENGRLSVRLEGGGSPAGHVVSVARINVGVYVDEPWWRVENLEIRHFGTTTGGSGVRARAANDLVVANNYVHTNGGRAIFISAGSADGLYEHNVCWDFRIGTWPWSATKAHEEEIAGISNRGGRGNVIRRNTISGLFDGMDAGDGQADENVAADADYSDNTVTHVGDDGIETDEIAAINLRVWSNTFADLFDGISVAPNFQGPEYVVGNTITGFTRSGFKFSLSSTGQTWIVNNTVWSTAPAAPAVKPSGIYSNMHFRNNILGASGAACVSDDAGESDTGNDFDYDLLYANYPALFRWKNTNYSTIAALRSATGFETGGRSGDPLFTSAATGDWTLQAGSPAVDAGVRIPGLNDRYFGAAPDIGAHERGGAAPDTIPPAAITDLQVGP
jgi:hypothetical protein